MDEGIEDRLLQIRGNGRAQVGDSEFDQRSESLSGYLNLLGRGVSDGIGDEIENDLDQPIPIPVSFQITHSRQLESGVGVGCLKLFEGQRANFSKIASGLNQRKRHAHSAPDEDGQVINQPLDTTRAAKDSIDAARLRFVKRRRPQNFARKLDYIQRIANFVGENSEKSVAVMF